VLLLSMFLYRHGPGHPVTVWQDQEDAKGTTSAFYFPASGGLYSVLVPTIFELEVCRCIGFGPAVTVF